MKTSADYMRTWRANKPLAAMLHQLQGRKSRTRIEGSGACELTIEDLAELCAPMVCSVTGVPLRWTDIDWDPWRPSVDRIDPDKGYLKGNVRLVCAMYNIARRRWSDEEVLYMAQSLVSKAQRK